MENKVTIREFTRNIYKYIKVNGIYTVTNKNGKSLVVTIEGNNSDTDVVTRDEIDADVDVVTINTGVRQGSVVTIERYGCGCNKESGKIFCRKHKRI